MPDPEYTPTVAEVGALLRARTKDSGGNEAGTFNANTRPTDAQVQDLISQAAGDVSLMIGFDIPDVLAGDAKSSVIYRTAMLIELSYYPEQVQSERSAYSQYKDLYDELIGNRTAPGSLVIAVRNAISDNKIDVEGPLQPKHSFTKQQRFTW